MATEILVAYALGVATLGCGVAIGASLLRARPGADRSGQIERSEAREILREVRTKDAARLN